MTRVHFVDEVDEDAEDRTPGEEEEEEEEFDPSQTDLVSHLQRVMARSYWICQPKQPQMVITNKIEPNFGYVPPLHSRTIQLQPRTVFTFRLGLAPGIIT